MNETRPDKSQTQFFKKRLNLVRQPSDEVDSLSFSEVFQHELEIIWSSREKRGVLTSALPLKEDLVGLAFSGGGIRSATFNLGVIQALAKNLKLSLIDYLSTVSGGGYIGSWLSSWAYYISKREPTNLNHIAQIEQALNRTPQAVGDWAEPPQIHFLRKYSNYLTPRLGLLSGDTLAFAGTYVRNLLLNQTIFISALLSLLLIPRTIERIFYEVRCDAGAAIFGVVAIFLLASVFVRILSNHAGRVDSARAVVWWVVVPLFLSCVSVAFVIWQLALGHFLALSSYREGLSVVMTTAMVYALLWVLAVATMPQAGNGTSTAYLRWAPAIWALPAGLVAGMLLLLTFHIFDRWTSGTFHDGADWLLAFGVPLVTAMVLLVGVVHLGSIGRAYSDELREWWARLGGAVLALTICWLLLSVVALFVPSWLQTLRLFLLNSDTSWATRTWKVLSSIGVTGALTAWIGATVKGLLDAKGTETGPRSNDREVSSKSRSTADLAARIAPPIFCVGLMVLLSSLARYFLPGDPRWYIIFAACVTLYLISRFFGYRVDVNEFSLHNAYRNRLVRCYLGATHDNRRAQPFTGFDDSDNIFLAGLKDLGAPFHILNATLNVIKGKELALQARKARSFVFTPLYSGFDHTKVRSVTNVTKTVNERSRRASASDPIGSEENAYRLTEHCSWRSRYPGARLGTAMAISGAAASPNMGHYTTGAVSFLLSIFSFRLGWWLGNPRKKRYWESGRPRSSWRAMFNELTGNTDDDQNEVYLSDGGHFENLGIYELVRRRCRVIIACDAGADSACNCNDLASAIEKCRVDFATRIEIKLDDIRPGNELPRISPSSFAIGTIHYPDDRKGTLIYVKPSLVANLPQDVQAYARRTKLFPHESTIDQFFDEVQFESYRTLGFECASTAMAEIDKAIRP